MDQYLLPLCQGFLKPDLVLVKDEQAWIVDPTVICDKHITPLNTASKGKIMKYRPLVAVEKTQTGAKKTKSSSL